MKSLNQATGKLIRFLHIYKSIVIGVLIFAGSAFMLYFTKDILVSSSSLTKIDKASFLPRVVFCILMFLSVLHVVTGVRHIKANTETAPSGEVLENRATQTLRSMAALGLLFVYVFLLDKLGFVITSILYMIAAMFHMTKKEDRQPILFVAIAVIMTVVVYFCFKQFLYIYLPNGILKGVF